jgi:hypothetical protein
MRAVAALLAATALAFPLAASANPVVGAEVDYAGADSLSGEGLAGVGFGVRAGWTLDLPLLRLEPELGASSFEFELDRCPEGATCSSLDLKRVFVGARAGLGTGVVPGAFVRASYGWADGGGDVYGGTLVEGGAFVDVRLLPWVELGVHGMIGRPDFENDVLDGMFWGAGAHLAVVL